MKRFMTLAAAFCGLTSFVASPAFAANVAKIGGFEYETLEAAFGAAKEYDVVTILDDTADVSDVASYVKEGLFPISNGDKTYTIRTAPNATVKKLPAFTLKPSDDYVCWPEGDTEGDRPLDIVMNFLANDDGKAEANATGFADWTCDFYLTLTGMTGGSIVADGCYLAGNYGGYGWYVIPCDDTIIDNGAVIPVVSGYDAHITYRQICEDVKKFTAAIHVDEAIMEANPELKINLALKMTNDKDSKQELVVGSYTYTVNDLKRVNNPPVEVAEGMTVEDAFKTTVGDALAEAYHETDGKLDITVKAKGEAFATIDVSAKEGFELPAEGLEMTFPAEAVANGETAFIVHKHGDKQYVYSAVCEYGFVTFNNTLGFSEFIVGDQTALANALAAGGEIVLESDIALSSMITVPESVTVTLDLNGYAITVPEVASGANHIYALNNKGVMTIKDTSAEGTGSISARGIYNGYNGDTEATVAGAKMTIEGGKFVGMDTNGGAAIFNCAELIIEDGAFEGQVAAVNTRAKGKTTINGGTFSAVSGYVIQNNGGELTITDATVDAGFGAVGTFGGTTVIENGTFLPTGVAGTTCHVVYVAGGANVTINGGTFKMNYSEDAKPDSGEAVASYYKGTVSITGGTFTSHFDNVSPVQLSSGATITGGSFLNHSGTPSSHTYITSYVPEGYELGEDGKVAVNSSVVAKIGDKTYETLADAIAAVGAGEVTITLLNDATLDYGAREAYGTDETTKVTIDGNGKVLTLNQTNSDWSSFGLKNADAVLVLTNMTINKTGHGATSGAWNKHTISFTCKLEMTNVTVNNSMRVDTDATLTNVTINEANGYYGLWIPANGQKVTVTGGSITATNGGRGIKIADEYIGEPAKIELAVEGTVFNTAKKAAVLVSSVAGAEITATDVDITNVAEDASNLVWIDDTAKYAATYGETSAEGTVVVNNETKDVAIGVEGGTDAFSVMTSNATGIQGYFKTLQAAIDAAQAGDVVTLIKDVSETVVVSKAITLDLNGKTITASGDVITVPDGANLTLRDTSAAGTGKVSCTGGYDAIYVCGGLFTLESGILESVAVDVIYVDGGKIAILGGTVNALDPANALTLHNGANTVSGGTINGKYNVGVNALSITGGTFTVNPATHVPDGYTVTTNDNGTYTVAPMPSAIYIGDDDTTAYRTLAEAFAVVGENETVRITMAGTYRWPTTALPAGVTVEGTVEGVTVEASTIDDFSFTVTNLSNVSTLTVKNIDFNAVSGKAVYVSGSKVEAMTFTDCSFTGAYAFHVNMANNADLTFNNCVFNGFTTFATTVESLDVNGGEINAGFIVRQDATLDGVTFAETAKVQLGTTDTVTDVTLTITDCNVNGDDSASALAGIIDTNGADSSNFVVVDDVTIYGGAAMIDDVRYATIQDAVDAAQAGETVVLLADVELDKYIDIPADKNLIIDLNGKTVTAGADGYALFNGDGGTVTIKDSLGGGEMIGAIENNESTMIITGGTFTALANYAIANSSGTMTINGGTFNGTADKKYTINSYKGSTSDLSHKLTINGATVNGAFGCLNTYGAGEVVIEDGTFNFTGIEGKTSHIVYLSSDTTMTINGGTFTKTGSVDLSGEGGGGICATGSAVLKITGGTFAGANADIYDYSSDTTIAISGGTYAHEPTAAYIEAGYRAMANADDTWTVTTSLVGEGTEAAPYLIKTADDLVLFRDSVNAGKTTYNAPGVWVALDADIDLASIETWVGIGSINADHGFMGNFNGNGHKILNLTIKNPALVDGYAYAGLFSITEGTDEDNQNIIKNLIIEGVTIETTGQIAAAAIAYPYYTIVENVEVCGDISIKGGNYTAGVLAYTRRCTDAKNLTISGNTGSVIEGKKTVGGVISDIQMNGGLTADYSNFNASGLTIKGDMHVGGISGIIAAQTLTGCSVKNVTLECSDARVGVVSGSLGGASTITNATIENVTGATAVIGGTYDDGHAVQARIGNTYYATLQAAVNAAQASETVKILCEVAVDTAIEVTATVTVDLNGQTVATTENDTEGNGVFYVTGGVLTLTDASEAKSGTVNGVGGNKWNIAIFADGGKVIINGGRYSNIGAQDTTDDATHFDLIYAKNGGSVEINGGTFMGETPAWLLNLHDGSRETSSISVTGGTFYGFNPANCNSEGQGTNFCALGYYATTTDEGVTYTVVEAMILDDEIIIEGEGASSGEELNEAAIAVLKKLAATKGQSITTIKVPTAVHAEALNDALVLFDDIVTIDDNGVAKVDWDFGITKVEHDGTDFTFTAKVQKGDATAAGYAEGVTVVLVDEAGEEVTIITPTTISDDGTATIKAELADVVGKKLKAKAKK